MMFLMWRDRIAVAGSLEEPRKTLKIQSLLPMIVLLLVVGSWYEYWPTKWSCFWYECQEAFRHVIIIVEGGRQKRKKTLKVENNIIDVAVG